MKSGSTSLKGVLTSRRGSIDQVRSFYRQLTSGNGVGMIEVEVMKLDGCDAIRSIFKQPQSPSGMTYLGSITLTFRDFSYVIKVQCEERGMTGMRDAVVLDAWMKSRKLDPKDPLRGWKGDPYDPTFKARIQRNVADDASYDAKFPDHALSRLRRVLDRIQASLRVAATVKAAPPFVFSGSSKNEGK